MPLSHFRINAKKIVSILVVLVVATIGSWLLISSYATVNAPSLNSVSWSKVHHQFGAFGIHDNAEAATALSNGIAFAVFNHATVPANFNRSYFDATLLDMIYGHYHNSCAGQPYSCTMSAAEQQTLENEAKQYIQQTKNNTNIIGYYLLDDPPGNVQSALIAVHKVVQDANQGLSSPRPTLCGFGAANLDYKDNASDPSYKAQHNDSVLDNFSPNACDLVTLYLYNYNHHYADWTMSQLLPHLKSQLQQRGWDATKTPLLGSPQAFGINSGNPASPSFYTTPTTEELATQTEAFCKGGAVGIIAFAWRFDDTSLDSDNLSSSSTLRQGLSQGAQRCQTYWASISPPATVNPPPTTVGSNPPPSPSPTGSTSSVPQTAKPRQTMSNTPTSTLNTVSSSGESVQMTNQPGSTALPSSKRSNKRLLIGFGLLGPATFLSLGILGLKFLKRKKAGITLAPPDIPQSPITIDPTVTNPDNNFETENKE